MHNMTFLLLVPTVKKWKQQFAELLKLPIIVTRKGLISVIEYKNENNKYHRNTDIAPTCITYYKNGRIMCESYWINGKRHRLYGPAIIYYDHSNWTWTEEYWVNGKKHRPIEEGPASISYYGNRQIYYKEYWVNGKKIKPKIR